MHENEVIKESTQLIEKGHFSDALVKLQAATNDYAKSYKLWSLLSKCLYELGRLNEAVQTSQYSQLIDPLDKNFRIIQVLIQKHSFIEATSIANEMLTKYAFHPAAICTLAHIATKKNDPETSINLLEKALNVFPANLTLRNMLTNSYASAGYFTKALNAAKKLVDLDETFDSLWTLIGLQLKYSQYDDLLETCTIAQNYVGHNPQKSSQLSLVRGQALRIIGNKTESIQALQSCLISDPNCADAWWALADMKDYAFSKDEHKKLKSLLASSKIDARLRCVAAFAYAKASELYMSPSKAMSHYHKANALGTSAQYHPQILENEFNARIKTYSEKYVTTQADITNKELTPIFIVGLPRSGSTLVEQILASHTQIIGTLEQPTLPIIESRAQALCIQRYGLSLPEGLKKLTPEELSGLGKAYLDESALFRAKETKFFIDKQPFNFRLIGFIHKILPQAIIIDVRRNPLDCGLSLYKQYFHSGVDFSYSLAHIGAVYKAYSKLMNHWHRVLPSRIYTQQYETLVNFPDQQIRAVLSHVGVPFEDSCKRFFKTKRSIHTASSEQVRKPLNKDGIGVWRKVETELLDLTNSLHSSAPYLHEGFDKT